MSWEDKTETLLSKCMSTFGVGEDGCFDYFPKSGGVGFKVPGIFDKAYQAVDPNTQTVVSSLIPNLGIKLSDLPTAPVKGDQVVVEGVRYKINEVQKDVHGGARLFLHYV